MSWALAVAWLGVFRPTAPLAASATRAVVGRAGEVIVLTPSDGSPAPTGEVAVVQPLTGMNIAGTIVHGRIALPLFAIDRREGADAVLLLPAAAVVRFVTPTPADVKAIEAVLIKDDVLAGVRRSLAGLEIGAVDLDGDGKADYAVTYGCNAWGDGQCQSHGAFFVVRTGAVWRELQ
ncbi:MAG: hypothetical protein ABI591_11590 [Kofleriaceae bacterium]